MTDLVHVPAPEQPHGDAGSEHGAEGGPQESGPRGKDWRLLRRLLIADLLLERVPERVMAKRLGCSKSTVHREIERIRSEWRQRSAETFDAHVAESVAVLDRLRSVALTHALAPDVSKPEWSAEARAIEDRRSRLLGLDAPAKAELSVTVEDLDAKKRRAAELLDAVDELERRRQSHGAA